MSRKWCIDEPLASESGSEEVCVGWEPGGGGNRFRGRIHDNWDDCDNSGDCGSDDG